MNRLVAVPRRHTLWPWLSVIPMGLGAWAPAYAGIQARVRSWVALGGVWSACTIAGWVSAVVTNANDHGIGGMLILAGWVGGGATSFIIRPAYRRRVEDPLAAQMERARQRLAERRQAIQLAQRDPQLALEMGIGRPDRPGAADAGLVDVNNAPAAVLTRVSGLSRDLAARIVTERERCGGFSSLEDVGMELDLDAPVVEGLRDRVVFLPMGASAGGS